MTEQFIKVSAIVANKFNPNMMQPEEFQALKKDMELHGAKEIDAILVSPFGCFYPCVKNPAKGAYVIVDGEHRWTAAKELLWDTVRCEVREVDEEEAKGICYRKNKDRGTIDPFKEAALFKSEVDLLTQKEIAEKYLVDPSTVSHRLSLLKLAPEIVKQVSMMPRGTVTPSHLEPIASLPEDVQKNIKLKDEWGRREVRSVEDITSEAKQIKERLAEQAALEKTVKSAKFPKCPKCGNAPNSINHQKLPWVNCASGHYDHAWNLETGKGQYNDERSSQNKIDGGKPEPIRPHSFRCMQTVEELSLAFMERCRELVPKLDEFSSFKISGKMGGKNVSVDFSSGTTMHISVSNGAYSSDSSIFFTAEPKNYKTGEKSHVDVSDPDRVEQVKEFIENAFQGKLEVPAKEKRIKGEIPDSATDISARLEEEQKLNGDEEE